MEYETYKEIFCVDNGDTFRIGDIVTFKTKDGGGCGGCTIVKITDTGFKFKHGGSYKSIQYKNIQEIY